MSGWEVFGVVAVVVLLLVGMRLLGIVSDRRAEDEFQRGLKRKINEGRQHEQQREST